MKLTMMAGYFYPEQSADTHLNYDMARELSEKGFDVTVVVPFPSRGLTSEEQKKYLDKTDERVSEHLRILRVGKPTAYTDSFARKAWNLFSKSRNLYRVAKKIPTDVYLVVSTPPFLGYAVPKLARRAKVVYKLQDVFPDSLIHSKGLTESHPLIRILRRKERNVYRFADRILACSDDVKKTLLSRAVPEEKIRVVYDWIDDKTCTPIPPEENYLFDRFGINRGVFNVYYAGNIGYLQNVETMVAAAERLKNENIFFTIIGDGAKKQKILQMIEEKQLHNIAVYPLQSVDKVSQVYSIGNVGIVTLKPEIARYALPSKTWSILSAGRMVICEIDTDTELASLIRERNLGVVVAPGDDRAMAEAILAASRAGEDTAEKGRNGRRFIENELNIDVAMKSIEDCILECGGKKK